MALSVQSLEDSKNFSNKLLEEAKKYNGRRVTLRKQVDLGFKPPELLDAHTQLMIDSRNIMKGMLFETKLEDKTVYIIGVCHVRIVELQELSKILVRRDMSFICQIIHPIVMEILNRSELYVEFDVQDFENQLDLGVQLAKMNLIPIPSYSPSQSKRTELIEFTATKLREWGLDHTLVEKQYRDVKKVFSLEKAEDQVLCLKMIVELQKNDPKNFYFSNECALEALDAVQWGNVKALTELDKEIPEDLAVVYQNRNVKMASQIFEKLSLGENSLFAVGASHLIGEKSILALLKERDVQIEQVSLE